MDDEIGSRLDGDPALRRRHTLSLSLPLADKTKTAKKPQHTIDRCAYRTGLQCPGRLPYPAVSPVPSGEPAAVHRIGVRGRMPRGDAPTVSCDQLPQSGGRCPFQLP